MKHKYEKTVKYKFEHESSQWRLLGEGAGVHDGGRRIMRHPTPSWTPAAKVHQLRQPKGAVGGKIKVAALPEKRYVYTLPTLFY